MLPCGTPRATQGLPDISSMTLLHLPAGYKALGAHTPLRGPVVHNKLLMQPICRLMQTQDDTTNALDGRIFRPF